MALSLLLLIVLAAADGFRISNLFQKQSDNILAVQWPPNVCQVKKWSGPGCAFDYWTIHGWWPLQSTDFNGDFSVTEIEDLTDNMEQVWPQLSGENNEEFWKYEWDKHGKTAGLAVHDYFEKALGYFNKVLGNCTNPKEISSCLREKGEVKEYQLVKEPLEGGKRVIERCTVNGCNALTETKGNSDISLRRRRRGRGRSIRKNRRRRRRRGRRNKHRRRGLGRKNRRRRRRSGRKNRRGRRRSGRKNRRGRRRSGRKNRRGRRGSHSGSIEHHSGSHSGSIEHHSRSDQSNDQEEYYIVEARLVLPGNLI
ncbi:uncharacterized protein LOC134346399 isoform X4 [Mobula hypostoma]|uniref:uncharacterized protein LOC134346399 isoform X2 n=1 Tax=Mobula hypostoma TaxID=723540 RepID=UPI002FC29211